MIVTALSLCCLIEAQPAADAEPQPIVEMWAAPRRVERTTSGGELAALPVDGSPTGTATAWWGSPIS